MIIKLQLIAVYGNQVVISDEKPDANRKDFLGANRMPHIINELCELALNWLNWVHTGLPKTECDENDGIRKGLYESIDIVLLRHRKHNYNRKSNQREIQRGRGRGYDV